MAYIYFLVIIKYKDGYGHLRVVEKWSYHQETLLHWKSIDGNHLVLRFLLLCFHGRQKKPARSRRKNMASSQVVRYHQRHRCFLVVGTTYQIWNRVCLEKESTHGKIPLHLVPHRDPRANGRKQKERKPLRMSALILQLRFAGARSQTPLKIINLRELALRGRYSKYDWQTHKKTKIRLA